MSFVKLPSHLLSGTILHFHRMLLAIQNCYKQPFTALEAFSYHTTTHCTLNLTYPHLGLAVTAASHPPPALTLSPRYVNSFTVSTSSHNFSFCCTASPIYHSHFQQKISLKLCSRPFHSGTSILDPLITQITYHKVSLLSSYRPHMGQHYF